MSIDIRVVSAQDLTVDNDVMNLRRMPMPTGNPIAGASWLVADSSAYEALLSVIRFLYGLIDNKLPNYKMWLLVGNSSLAARHKDCSTL